MEFKIIIIYRHIKTASFLKLAVLCLKIALNNSINGSTKKYVILFCKNHKLPSGHNFKFTAEVRKSICGKAGVVTSAAYFLGKIINVYLSPEKGKA